MIPSEESLSRMIAGLRGGDLQVQMEFWTRYGPLLEQIAAKNMEQGQDDRFGPEDVAQSACRTFFRRAQESKYQLSETEELWSLLCAITLTKLLEKARLYPSQKHEGTQTGVEQDSMLAAEAPAPTEAIEFSNLLETVLASLNGEERQVMHLKLQDFTHEEVAEQLGFSERTVRRLLNKVRSRLERILQKE